MAIYLSHTTARRFWAYVGAGARRLPTLVEPGLPSAQGRVSELAACPLGLLGGSEGAAAGRPVWVPSPVDVLVPAGMARTSDRRVRVHVITGELPRGSLRGIGDDVYVTSPELTFLQMGCALSMAQLAQYAMELCGAYAVTPWDGSGFARRAPLCNQEGLNDFLGENHAARGSRRAREAVRLAAAGSYSPAETRLFLLLTLPRKLFGYGLPAPLLNRRIDIPFDVQRRLGVEFLRPDLLFPGAREIVEYESREFHSSSAQLSGDDERREELEALGYGVTVVRDRRLENARSFDALVRNRLAPRLGAEVPPSDPRFLRGVQDLRDDLRAFG